MLSHNRRRVLTSLGGGLAALIGGCAANSDGETAATTTRSDSNPSGGKPPWLHPSSDADVVVVNATSEQITVTVSTTGFETEAEIRSRNQWVSGDILKRGEDAQVAVRVDGGPAETVRWGATPDSPRVVVFAVTGDAIRVREHGVDSPTSATG